MKRRPLPFGRFLTFATVVTLFLTVVPHISLAQSQGWELLRSNEHLKARDWFEKKLAEDSLDLSALKGMIILSEIHGDPLRYRDYVTRYIQATWDEPVYRIFRNVFDASDTVIVDSPMSEGGKISSRISLAAEHLLYRQREKGEKAFRDLAPANRWSLVGPFENIGGSGYLTSYPVETQPFDPKGEFKNHLGVPLRWVRPTDVDPVGQVMAEQYVPDGDVEVVYANTFLTLPSDRRVQIRLGRSSPISIWVDDDLVFTDKEVIVFEYDNEIISLPLTAGTHRILVKTSPFYEGRDSYSFLEVATWRRRYRSTSETSLYPQGFFLLRFTDETGATLADAELQYEGKYKKATYSPDVRRREMIDYFTKGVSENPDDLFTLYMLAKAYLVSGYTLEGEELFTKKLGENDNMLVRWLLAKLYASNGKLERVYEILERSKPETTPVYGLLSERLEEIDPKTREEEYLKRLQELRKIAPSNFSLIRQTIDFYTEKDRKQESDAFIDKMIEEFPEYKEDLEYYRSDYKYRSTVDERTPREIADSLLTAIEKKIDEDAYDELIEYFTDKESVDTVLMLHDQLIDAYPGWVYYRRQKATYLREEKRYQEAIETLKGGLGVFPYSASLYEQIGDLYLDMERKKDALEYYLKGFAVDVNGYSHRSGYRENSLVQKIENMTGAEDVNTLFTAGLSFDDALASDDWRERYEDEESVIQLYEKRQIVDTLGRVRSWSKMMIRILTEAGADMWTEYDFGMLGVVNLVRVRKASGAEVVPDRMRGMVVFKNLEPGDIIFLEGQSESTLFDDLFDGEYFDITYFSFGAPIHEARLEVLVPEGEYLGYLHQRIEDNVVKARSKTYDSYVWHYKNLDRTPDEEAMLDGWDGLRTIFVSTMPDWSRVADWYTRKTYRRTDATYDVRNILDSIIIDGMSDAEKIEVIYNYITRRVNYSYVPFLQSAYTPKSCDLTISSNVGDCKDVATLMIAMLREVGIDAWYALVKTNSFNHARFLPCQLFDHVIVGLELEGEKRYMDLTTNFFPHNVIPYSDCGAWALNIKDGEKDIFQLPYDHINPEKNLIEMQVRAVLDTARAVALDVQAEHRGLEGAYIRESMARLSKEEVRNMILGLLGQGTFQDVRLRDYDFANRLSITEPLRSHYTLSGERFSDRVSNLYIFRLPWMLAIRNSSAIKTSERVTTLDVAKLCETAPSRQRVEIMFPKGYQMTEIPENIEVESEFGLYRVKFRSIEGGLEAEKYQQFYTTRVPPEKFEEFREFYLRLLDLDEARYAIIRPK